MSDHPDPYRRAVVGGGVLAAAFGATPAQAAWRPKPPRSGFVPTLRRTRRPRCSGRLPPPPEADRRSASRPAATAWVDLRCRPARG